MNIFQHRAGLVNTLAALKRKHLTIGFVGGSITESRPGYNWPEAVIAWFCEKFPHVRITVENAALGATGSDLAVWRIKPDVLDRHCDLVFMEYAVNDGGVPTTQRNRTREGCIRQLLADAGRDVVLTYTYSQDFYTDMMAERLPASIAEFEVLASHYNLGSVWMSLNALNEIRSGKMRWEEWLPDGLHPQHRGSLSYADAVNQYLQRELIDAPNLQGVACASVLPAPVDAKNYQLARRIPLDSIVTTGPWVLRRWQGVPFAPYVLDTAAVGAKLSFDFEGRALVLGFDFGKTSSEFRYRLDGGAWKNSDRDRPDWCGPSGWYRTFHVADDLPTGMHTFEMELVHGNAPGCTGTNCRLALAGVID